MFAGTGGSGVKDMPSAHSRVMPKKCVTCHMHKEGKDAEKKADTPQQKGGHTFLPDDRACLKCHESPKSMVAEWRAKTSSLLKQLKTLLDNTSDKTSKSYKVVQLNYGIVIADCGMGTHNPKYAQALLQYSILSLMTESAWRK